MPSSLPSTGRPVSSSSSSSVRMRQPLTFPLTHSTAKPSIHQLHPKLQSSPYLHILSTGRSRSGATHSQHTHRDRDRDRDGKHQQSQHNDSATISAEGNVKSNHAENDTHSVNKSQTDGIHQHWKLRPSTASSLVRKTKRINTRKKPSSAASTTAHRAYHKAAWSNDVANIIPSVAVHHSEAYRTLTRSSSSISSASSFNASPRRSTAIPSNSSHSNNVSGHNNHRMKHELELQRRAAVAAKVKRLRENQRIQREQELYQQHLRNEQRDSERELLKSDRQAILHEQQQKYRQRVSYEQQLIKQQELEEQMREELKQHNTKQLYEKIVAIREEMIVKRERAERRASPNGKKMLPKARDSVITSLNGRSASTRTYDHMSSCMPSAMQHLTMNEKTMSPSQLSSASTQYNERHDDVVAHLVAADSNTETATSYSYSSTSANAGEAGDDDDSFQVRDVIAPVPTSPLHADSLRDRMHTHKHTHQRHTPPTSELPHSQIAHNLYQPYIHPSTLAVDMNHATNGECNEGFPWLSAGGDASNTSSASTHNRHDSADEQHSFVVVDADPHTHASAVTSNSSHVARFNEVKPAPTASSPPSVSASTSTSSSRNKKPSWLLGDTGLRDLDITLSGW